MMLELLKRTFEVAVKSREDYGTLIKLREKIIGVTGIKINQVTIKTLEHY
jgi:hypothetical protein